MSVFAGNLSAVPQPRRVHGGPATSGCTPSSPTAPSRTMSDLRRTPARRRFSPAPPPIDSPLVGEPRFTQIVGRILIGSPDRRSFSRAGRRIAGGHWPHHPFAVVRPGGRLAARLLALTQLDLARDPRLGGDADGGRQHRCRKLGAELRIRALRWVQHLLWARLDPPPSRGRRSRHAHPTRVVALVIIVAVAAVAAILLIVVVLARPTSSCITINQGPGGRIDARRDTHLSFHLSGPPLG